MFFLRLLDIQLFCSKCLNAFVSNLVSTGDLETGGAGAQTQVRQRGTSETAGRLYRYLGWAQYENFVFVCQTSKLILAMNSIICCWSTRQRKLF